MKNLIKLVVILMLTMSCNSKSKQTSTQEMTTEPLNKINIDFWNGNRSEIRQRYEREVLEALLKATSSQYGSFEISETLTEYPGIQESLVFSEKQHHLFVTIAGNQKFKANDMIVIAKPIAKNLLGYRIPIIKKDVFENFRDITSSQQLKNLTHGIPETWSDATIFRHNDYKVSEEGSFDDIFERLAAGNFDYTAFGANEVVSVFENRASKHESLTIEDNLMLFYPFPLVFYVNPNMPELAQRIDQGLQAIIDSGELDDIFNRYYDNIVQTLNLEKRTLFMLENPLIPEEFADLKPDLLGLL